MSAVSNSLRPSNQHHMTCFTPQRRAGRMRLWFESLFLDYYLRINQISMTLMCLLNSPFIIFTSRPPFSFLISISPVPFNRSIFRILRSLLLTAISTASFREREILPLSLISLSRGALLNTSLIVTWLH